MIAAVARPALDAVRAAAPPGALLVSARDRVWEHAPPAEAVGRARLGELPRLLPAADYVVILAPLTDESRGLVDAAFLASMGDDAVLDVTDPEPLVNVVIEA